MAKVRWPVIALLAIVGFVWLGQGIGAIGGSFMTGEPLWAVVGAVMLVAAGLLAITGRRGN